MVFTSEIHGCGDIVGVSGGNRINARLGRPRIRPSQGLRDAGLVANVERIVEILESVLTGCTVGSAFARGEWELHGDKIAADLLLQLLPACGARPRRIAGTDSLEGRLRSGLRRLGMG